MTIPIEAQIRHVRAQANRTAMRDPGSEAEVALRAAAATLAWLAENAAAIRCIAGSLAAIKRDPAVRRVLDTWPDATIVAIRERSGS
jgi:hypothetical protein